MIDEIAAYKNEQGVHGDLARELLSILNDYRGGALTLEEKNELVSDVIKIYQEAEHAQDEVTVRWIASAANIAIGFA